MMKRKLWIVLVLIFVSLMWSDLESEAKDSEQAREEHLIDSQIKQGISEVNFGGIFNITSSEGRSLTSLVLSVSYGYFATKHLEIGAEYSLFKIEGSDAFGTIAPFLTVHFPSSDNANVVPFVGGTIGSGYGDDDDLS